MSVSTYPRLPALLLEAFDEDDDEDVGVPPHWHVPAGQCDHRTFQCQSCCPHPEDA